MVAEGMRSSWCLLNPSRVETFMAIFPGSYPGLSYETPSACEQVAIYS
jgi:hypothetical protein